MDGINHPGRWRRKTKKIGIIPFDILPITKHHDCVCSQVNNRKYKYHVFEPSKFLRFSASYINSIDQQTKNNKPIQKGKQF